MSGFNNAIAQGSSFNPFEAARLGKQDKLRKKSVEAQNKSRSLSDQVREMQIKQADDDNKRRINEAEMIQAAETDTKAFLQGDAEAGTRLKGSEHGRKILVQLQSLKPEEKMQLIHGQEAIDLGLDPGTVAQFNPNDGSLKRIQAGQAPLTPQQQQSQAFEREKFEALNADRQADNQRADESLELRKAATEQRQQQLEAKAAQGPRLTADAAKSQGFHLRMNESSEIINQFEADETFDPTNIRKGVFTSQKHRQYNQAKQNWVRANLRAESGAVIGADEMEDEVKTYFPVPFDGPEVIAQKSQARQFAQEAMRLRSGISQPDLSQIDSTRALEIDASQITDLETLRQINEALSQ